MYAEGVNFTSLLFMNVYRIYIFNIVWFVSPLCWWIDKKGEKYLMSLYMHVYFISLFYTKRRRRILRVYICMFIFLFNAYMFCLCTKRRSIWRVYLYLFPHLCIYMLFVLCTSFIIFMFIAMHELRGSFYKA